MRLKVLNIADVVSSQLCTGCGACASDQPESIEMVDVLDYGRRPRVRNHADANAAERAMRVCPGVGLEHASSVPEHDMIAELYAGWGPIYAIYEGYAGDQGIRRAGSSGGAASALALHALEQQKMAGVLHTAAREDVPYLNETVMSRSRDELFNRTGSRYAPASPCDGLSQIEQAPGQCVFIGKPCDVAAAAKMRKHRPELDEKIGLMIGFFCAGTPTTRGTLEMLDRMGVEKPEQLISLRYRGNGWPGMATAVYRREDGSIETQQLTYAQSWGEVLQKHRQWRCHVCADHTGEFADVAVGDPWYRKIRDGEAGQSLILARTPRGKAAIEAAIESGYLVAERVDGSLLPASQPNLMETRGSIWGRIATCRLLGIPAPRFVNMPMFRFWISELTIKKKLQSISGTVRRIFRRGLYKPVAMEDSKIIGERQAHPTDGGGVDCDFETTNVSRRDEQCSTSAV